MTMYDGTLTIADPDLAAELDGMPDGYRAYVRYDRDTDAPGWDGIGYVYRLNFTDRRGDDLVIPGDTGEADPTPVDVVRAAWDQYRDWGLVERYLRAFHDVAAFDVMDDPGSRDGHVVACVTRAHVATWGTPDDRTARLAAEALDVYRQWAEGSVYGVIVVNESTGAEVSVWDVYDGSADWTYCREVAAELLSEVQS